MGEAAGETKNRPASQYAATGMSEKNKEVTLTEGNNPNASIRNVLELGKRLMSE